MTKHSLFRYNDIITVLQRGALSMDINFELYKTFFYVVETGSFSGAAQILYVSQSAVSQSVKTLEQRIGYPLFIRSTKKIKLTPSGELLYQYVQPAIKMIKEGESQFSNPESFHSGQLHIGASDTICRYFLLPYIKNFHNRFPDISIKVTNQTSLKCVELLANGDVDLIVTNSPNSGFREEFIHKIIGEFSDIFIAGQDFKFLKKERLSLRDLQNYPLLMLDSQSTTSEFLHQTFRSYQLELKPAIELGSNDLLIDLARINLGIAFIPDFCLQNDHPDLFQVSIKEPLPKRQIIASFTSALPTSLATKQFIEFLPKIQ